MHPCPIKGCTESIGDTRLMCQPHWLAADLALRGKVLSAYASLRGAAGTQGPEADAAKRHYIEARQQVIDQVNEAEAEAKQMLADELMKAWVFNEAQLSAALDEWARTMDGVTTPAEFSSHVAVMSVRSFLDSDAARRHKLLMGMKL